MKFKIHPILKELEADHERFHRYAAAFLDEAGKLKAGERANNLLLNELALYFSIYPDELHHKKEDVIYERYLHKHIASRGDVTDLLNEHITLSGKANTFSEVVTGYINREIDRADVLLQAGQNYFEALTRHMTMEDTCLFRPVAEKFREADWEVVDLLLGDVFAVEIDFAKARRATAMANSIDALLAVKKPRV